uniref:Uncharacterized protein n=1 Tax=Anguilla anguilla TaxID=7936 RepID=A0A0E9T8H5_ANGAN
MSFAYCRATRLSLSLMYLKSQPQLQVWRLCYSF